jgi:hypothetical protein
MQRNQFLYMSDQRACGERWEGPSCGEFLLDGPRHVTPIMQRDRNTTDTEPRPIMLRSCARSGEGNGSRDAARKRIMHWGSDTRHKSGTRTMLSNSDNGRKRGTRIMQRKLASCSGAWTHVKKEGLGSYSQDDTEDTGNVSEITVEI